MNTLTKPNLHIVEESFACACRRLVSSTDRRKGSEERMIALGRLRILAHAAVRHALAICVECAEIGCQTDQRVQHHVAACHSFSMAEECYQVKAAASLVERYASRWTLEPDDEFAYLLQASREAMQVADDAARGFERSWQSHIENDELQRDVLNRALALFALAAGLSRVDHDANQRLARIEHAALEAMAAITTAEAARQAGRGDAVLILLTKECEAPHV